MAVLFKETTFTLKDGREALLRGPREEDAEELLAFVVQALGETEFLLSYPEEFSGFTLEKERAFIRSNNSNPNGLMIACFVGGRLAGDCQLSFRSGLKTRHRASVAVTILKEFWGLGIGTRMFEEMIRLAQERQGVRQIELEFTEGNRRARALYEKMGFRITGVQPDAIQLKDGTLLNAYTMMKRL